MSVSLFIVRIDSLLSLTLLLAPPCKKVVGSTVEKAMADRVCEKSTISKGSPTPFSKAATAPTNSSRKSCLVACMKVSLRVAVPAPPSNSPEPFSTSADSISTLSGAEATGGAVDIAFSSPTVAILATLSFCLLRALP